MVKTQEELISIYKELVNENKINESIKVLDRIISTDNNNVYALLEKGFAKLFLNTDLSYNIDTVLNDFDSAFSYIFKANDVSLDKKTIIKKSYLKLIEQMKNNFSMFPKLVMIPYKIFIEKYSIDMAKFSLEKTFDLYSLYDTIDIYIKKNHKMHGIKFDYIKELRSEVECLLKAENELNVKLYWLVNKSSENNYISKRNEQLEELKRIQYTYLNSELFLEVQNLKNEYEDYFISSRERYNKNKIKDYLSNRKIVLKSNKIRNLEDELNNNNKEVYSICDKYRRKISYYNKILETGEFTEVKIFDKVLVTKNLKLRRINRVDATNMYDYAKVPGFNEKTGSEFHSSIDHTKSIIEFLSFYNKTFSIILRRSNIMIGTICYDRVYEHKLAIKNKFGFELEYSLSDNYSNNGYMTETVKSVIDFLFNDIKVDYILCGHFIGNNQSKRVLEKNNFTYLDDVFIKLFDKTLSYYIKYNEQN